jgi:hypothetical protein
MNHHAEKLVQPTGAVDEPMVDPALGGIVEEVHACPACGKQAARRRAPS